MTFDSTDELHISKIAAAIRTARDEISYWQIGLSAVVITDRIVECICDELDDEAAMRFRLLCE
jgi:predicted neutral ceramidase superfamily lipid hydrolase